jgi:tetratricopeptide (TPR) repeat protein
VLSIYGLAFYLWKSVMPFGLSPLYQLDFTVTWLHFGAVAALLGIALLMRRRGPAFAVATVAYVATLLPVLGIFQNGPQAAADRYTYLACLGWAVILGGLAARRWPGRNVTRVVLSIWVLAMLPLTWQQVMVWRDSVSLWSHAIALAPHSRAARFNLAGAHEEAGRYAAAVAEYENVARLSNRFKGRWYITIGWNYEKAKVDRLALAAFRTALSLARASNGAFDPAIAPILAGWGLLPRLANAVRVVYVEATPEDTETRLLRGMEKACPDLPKNLSLREAIGGSNGPS